MTDQARRCHHCREAVKVTEVAVQAVELKDGHKIEARAVEVLFCPRCDVPPKEPA